MLVSAPSCFEGKATNYHVAYEFDRSTYPADFFEHISNDRRPRDSFPYRPWHGIATSKEAESGKARISGMKNVLGFGKHKGSLAYQSQSYACVYIASHDLRAQDQNYPGDPFPLRL